MPEGRNERGRRSRSRSHDRGGRNRRTSRSRSRGRRSRSRDRRGRDRRDERRPGDRDYGRERGGERRTSPRRHERDGTSRRSRSRDRQEPQKQHIEDSFTIELVASDDSVHAVQLQCNPRMSVAGLRRRCPLPPFPQTTSICRHPQACLGDVRRSLWLSGGAGHHIARRRGHQASPARRSFARRFVMPSAASAPEVFYPMPSCGRRRIRVQTLLRDGAQ